MKKLSTIILILLVSVIVLAASEDQAKEASTQEKPSVQDKAVRQPGQASRRRGPVDRSQMYREMLARRAEEHQKAIAELVAIKEIAEEEGATRTVEALQKMIDKKNAEYKKNAERFEMQRRQRADQIRQRSEAVPGRRAISERENKKEAEE